MAFQLIPKRLELLGSGLNQNLLLRLISFHGLVFFYGRFIRGFSNIMTPITESLKNEEFQWSNSASQTFREIKVKMTKALVLR